MTGLGTHNTRHLHYAVDGDKKKFPPERTLMDSAFASPSSPFPRIGDCTSSPTPPTSPVPSSVSPGKSLQSHSSHDQSSPLDSTSPDPESFNKDRIALLKGGEGSYRRLDQISAVPHRIKEYCSYWLRHGECDYAQQGCLYKHEMPLDRGVLEKLGLRDIPRWYREKHGLASYLGGNVSVGIQENSRPNILERNWRPLPGQPPVNEDFCNRMRGLNISKHASSPPRRIMHAPPKRPGYQSPRHGGLASSRYASPFPPSPRAPPIEPLSFRRAREAAAAAKSNSKSSFDAPLPRGSLSNFPPLIPDLQEPSIPTKLILGDSSSTTSSSTSSTATTKPANRPAIPATENKTNAARTGTSAQRTPAGPKTVVAGAPKGDTASSSSTATTGRGRSRRGGHAHSRRRAAAKAKERAAKEALAKGGKEIANTMAIEHKLKISEQQVTKVPVQALMEIAEKAKKD